MYTPRDMEVLVAGAGPVGLFHALECSARGLETRVFDEEWKTAARSYALALHPRTLATLDRHRLVPLLAERGHRIDRVCYYDAAAPRATVELGSLDRAHPYLLVVSQGDLERTIEGRLKEGGGSVRWNHRLTRVSTQNTMPRVAVGRLAPTFRGGATQDAEWSIEDEIELHPHFVLAADGRESFVRRSLEIPWDLVGTPQFFAVFEFRTSGEISPQVHVVIDDHGTSVLWPLPGGRARWSFAISRPNDLVRWEPKVRVAVPRLNRETLPDPDAEFSKLVAERAPWFDQPVDGIDWFTVVRFDDGLAREFGREHIWLAGDAAHHTGPIPVRGMNLALAEAESFCELVEAALTDHASVDDLAGWSGRRRNEWLAMADAPARVRAGARADAWVARNAGRIVATLPATGRDLATLADQIGIVGLDH